MLDRDSYAQSLTLAYACVYAAAIYTANIKSGRWYVEAVIYLSCALVAVLTGSRGPVLALAALALLNSMYRFRAGIIAVCVLSALGILGVAFTDLLPLAVIERFSLIYDGMVLGQASAAEAALTGRGEDGVPQSQHGIARR